MENSAVQTEDISFDQLEGIMGNLADGFVLTDKDSRVVYMNKSADRKSTRLNSSHEFVSRMPSSA